MVDWNKESDWLPLSNALAHVIFWKDDLRRAQAFLGVLEGMGVDPHHKMMIVAQQDVVVSERGLRAAQDKLRETYKRIFSS